VNKDQIVRDIVFERSRTLKLIRGLQETDFDSPTALPGWRVREVLAHLVTTDIAVVTGSILPQLLSRSTDRLERWNDGQVAKWADRPIQELILGLDRWGHRFAALARVAPRPLFKLRLPSAWGTEPVGMMLWIRAYDEWVHRQDIRRALGMGDESVDLASIAEFLLKAMGYTVVPKVPKVAGMMGDVVVALREVPLPEWRFDLAGGGSGPIGSHGPESAGLNGAERTPSARISVPGAAFIMAAAGRDPSFDALIASGDMAVQGNTELARALLGKTRVV
jgi:uncharacterized protein (TIGR03083 family)